MRNWQEDLVETSQSATTEQVALEKILAAARALGFEHCAYGLRMPVPFSKPKTLILNSYPMAWQERYAANGYLHNDPTVQHGRRSQEPLIWSEEVFRSTPQLWEEAQSFGLRVGWAQSSLDAIGVGGMLTLARSGEALSQSELASKEVRMRWLVNISHLTLARLLSSKERAGNRPNLTAREIEVLQWTADGKTSSEISELLSVSENTVNFHVKNAIAKLQSSNKTAAVVRAAVLGLLN